MSSSYGQSSSVSLLSTHDSRMSRILISRNGFSNNILTLIGILQFRSHPSETSCSDSICPFGSDISNGRTHPSPFVPADAKVLANQSQPGTSLSADQFACVCHGCCHSQCFDGLVSVIDTPTGKKAKQIKKSYSAPLYLTNITS